MNPKKALLPFATACFALAFAIMALVASAKCHADPYDDRNHDAAIFCRDLDRDHSINGVYLAFGKPLQQGIEKDRVVDTTTYALEAICPEYKPAVEAAIAAAQKKDWGAYAA